MRRIHINDTLDLNYISSRPNLSFSVPEFYSDIIRLDGQKIIPLLHGSGQVSVTDPDVGQIDKILVVIYE